MVSSPRSAGAGLMPDVGQKLLSFLGKMGSHILEVDPRRVTDRQIIGFMVVHRSVSAAPLLC